MKSAQTPGLRILWWFSPMSKRILVAGDILAIAIVTFVGFVTHGEAELSVLPRMAAAFLPLLAGWFLLAPPLGLFRDETIHSASQLWRPAWAGLFAGPLAAVLRGFLLNAPVIPIFAAVLAAVTALGMVIWRAVFLLLSRRTAEASRG